MAVMKFNSLARANALHRRLPPLRCGSVASVPLRWLDVFTYLAVVLREGECLPDECLHICLSIAS